MIAEIKPGETAWQTEPRIVLAIDPGTEKSAWVLWDGSRVIGAGIDDNEKLRFMLHARSIPHTSAAVEMVACYGMPVGREVFQTCVWIGRFSEHIDAEMVFRRDVKLHLCNSAKAKDANIRQALLDRLGHVGTKGNPGPLYGVKSHLWAALAVAVYWFDSLESRAA
jgi:hypothetical protein